MYFGFEAVESLLGSELTERDLEVESLDFPSGLLSCKVLDEVVEDEISSFFLVFPSCTVDFSLLSIVRLARESTRSSLCFFVAGIPPGNEGNSDSDFTSCEALFFVSSGFLS